MRVIVLGCGMMGTSVAMDMANTHEVTELVLADIVEDEAKKIVARTTSDKVRSQQVDVTDIDATGALMEGFDVAVCALPEGRNTYASQAAVDAQVHLVDLAYGDRQKDYDHPAKDAGITILLDCGVAPGLTNILAAHGAAGMDEVDDIRIICGGIPQSPVPPLGYKIVWSAEGLIGMYCGKARMLKDGSVTEVDAMSDLELVDFPGVGKLEAFNTDGLSSLLHTLKGRVKNMREKTARWPGHAEKILAIREAGFFSTEPVVVNGAEVVPRRVAVPVLDRALRSGDVKDMTVLRVDVRGKKKGKSVGSSFVLVDRYDEMLGMTSMARVTGYTAAIIARMVGRGDIKERGVVPPETAVAKLYDKFSSELRAKGVRIEETTTTGE